jgi:hypothetical protein
MKDEKKLTNSWQVSRCDDCLAWKTTRKVTTSRNNVKQWCGLKGQIGKKNCFIKQKKILKNSQRKGKEGETKEKYQIKRNSSTSLSNYFHLHLQFLLHLLLHRQRSGRETYGVRLRSAVVV